MPRSLWEHRFALLIGLVLVTGAGLGFWAYRNLYLPYRGQTESAILSADHIVGFQTIDKVILRIRLLNSGGTRLWGTLHVGLTDLNGRVLGERDKPVNQTEPEADYRVEIPAGRLVAQRIVLQCYLGNQKLVVPLSRVLAVKVHETALTADREFIAGTPAALRCGVHVVQSLGGDIPVINADIRAGQRRRKRSIMQRTPETSPLAGAEVRVSLRAKDGTIYALHQGMTGKDGWDQASFTVPAVPSGTYTLQVNTRSDLGDDSLEQSVRVTAPATVRLTADKRQYHPGQTIHLRAVARRAFDRKPLEGATPAITIEDAQGNRIFHQSERTAADGSATVDCPLAAAAPLGAYRIRAVLGDQQAETTVAVQHPAQPHFKVTLTADKSYYPPGATIHAEMQVDSAAGRPVIGATLKAAAVLADDTDEPLQSWEGSTDSRGHAHWDITVPEDLEKPSLENGPTEIRLEVKATDAAGHTELVRRSFPISDQAIQVRLIPEGGRLVPDLENRIYVAAMYPDGRPTACSVIIRQGKDPHGQIVDTVPTSPAGLGVFRYTPRKAYLHTGPRQKFIKEMLGNRQETELVPELFQDFTVEAARDTGNRRVVTLNCKPLGENLVLHLDRTIYRPGDTLSLQVLATPGLPSPYVDVVRDGQLVLTRNLVMENGVASARLDLPPGLVGALEVHAYQTIDTGEIFRDTRVIDVVPAARAGAPGAKNLPSAISSERIRFRPATGSQTAEPGGGMITVDERAYPLVDLAPGLDKVYAALQGEWLQLTDRLPAAQANDLEIVERRQQVAGALLAAIQPRPPQLWVVEPVVQRHYRAYDQARQVAWGIFAYARSGRPFMDYDAQTRHWAFRPNLLQEMIQAGALNASLLDGPFGNRLLLAELPRWDVNFSVDRVAELVTWERWLRLIDILVKYTDQHPEFRQPGRWTFPSTVLADAVRAQKQDPLLLQDAWGQPTQLIRRSLKAANKTGLTQLDFHELVSAGPDRTFDTLDDLHFFDPIFRQRVEEPLFGITLADYLEGGLAPPVGPAPSHATR